jgi:spore coat polysaccharide biosynthesis predicted glycosyltransferase SpsG
MHMTRGPILFRCDGTPETGFESFYQCLAFAAALQRRRRGTHFLSYLDPLSLAPVIHRGNNDWNPAESLMGGPGDLDQLVRETRRLGAAAVVLAGNRVTPDYVERLNDLGVCTVVFHAGGASSPMPAKLLVNPMLAPSRRSIRPLVGTQLLHGAKFSLVRGIFRRQRTIRATEQPGPFRALVAMGDDDAADQTWQRLHELLDTPKVDKVSVAIRPHHERYDELRELAASSKGRVDLALEPKELMTRLVRAHFAVTTGDAWSLELACVGIPQLVLPTAPHHMANAKQLDAEGVATLVGPASSTTAEQLREAVAIVLDDPMERLGMTRCARNLVDGRGGDRIVNGLEILLHTPPRVQPGVLRIAA